MKHSRLRRWLLPLLAAVGAGVFVAWWAQPAVPTPLSMLVTEGEFVGSPSHGRLMHLFYRQTDTQQPRLQRVDLRTGQVQDVPLPDIGSDEAIGVGPSVVWTQAAMADSKSKVRAFDLATGRQLLERTVRWHLSPADGDCYLADEAVVIGVEHWLTFGLRLRCWDPRTGRTTVDLVLPQAKAPLPQVVTRSPDGRWAAIFMMLVDAQKQISASVVVVDLHARRQVAVLPDRLLTGYPWNDSGTELLVVRGNREGDREETVAERVALPSCEVRGRIVLNAPRLTTAPVDRYRIPLAFLEKTNEWLLIESLADEDKYSWLPEIIRKRLPRKWLEPSDSNRVVMMHESDGRSRTVGLRLHPMHHLHSSCNGTSILLEQESSSDGITYAFYPLAGSYPWPWPWRVMAMGLAALLAFITFRRLLAPKSGGHQPAAKERTEEQRTENRE